LIYYCAVLIVHWIGAMLMKAEYYLKICWG